MPESVNERFGNRKEYRSGVKDMYDENEDFRITIDLSSPEPIYKQIYNDIVKNIAMGILKKGDRLPSSRELSSILGINYHTVNKAYGYLEMEEYIFQDRRKHIIVNEITESKERKMDSMWEMQIKNLLLESISKGYSVDQVRQRINELIEEIVEQKR